jgi:hypothetical protein
MSLAAMRPNNFVRWTLIGTDLLPGLSIKPDLSRTFGYQWILHAYARVQSGCSFGKHSIVNAPLDL